MRNYERVDSEETWQAQSLLWSNIYSYVKSMALKCAIRLRIPEIIHNHGRPATLHELMAAVSIPAAKADPLRCLMRMLTDSGIFVVDQNGAYVLTPASRLLLPGPAGTSFAALSLLSLEPGMVGLWNHFNEWYKADKAGVTCFDVAHGMSAWDYLRGQPQLQGYFNDAVAADSQLLMDTVVKNCSEVFKGLQSMVDAGGGIGMVAVTALIHGRNRGEKLGLRIKPVAAAKAIRWAFPEIEVTVLDLPHVVTGLPKEDDDSGVKYVGGDILKSIPPADAIFFKWILHIWTDDVCVEVLKRCKEAIPAREAGGKVIIVDMVVDPNCKDAAARETQFAYDLVMLVASLGKEREEEERKKIFKDAGFSDYKITPA